MAKALGIIAEYDPFHLGHDLSYPDTLLSEVSRLLRTSGQEPRWLFHPA